MFYLRVLGFPNRNAGFKGPNEGLFLTNKHAS